MFGNVRFVFFRALVRVDVMVIIFVCVVVCVFVVLYNDIKDGDGEVKILFVDGKVNLVYGMDIVKKIDVGEYVLRLSSGKSYGLVLRLSYFKIVVVGVLVFLVMVIGLIGLV